MMKNKINPNIYFVFVLLFAIISFFCHKENNIVNPPVEEVIIDSNFFDWQTTEIWGTNLSGAMFVIDSNKVIMDGCPNAVLYNNGVLTDVNFNDPNYSSRTVNGIDGNNIYFGGITTDMSQKPLLKKWDGHSFTDIPIPHDSASYIYIILPVNYNELWLSTTYDYIYHYVNGNVQTYRLGNPIQDTWITIDKFQNIKAFARRSLLSITPSIFYTFDYLNNSWVNVISDTITESSELQFMIGDINGTCVRRGLSGIYKLENNTWIKFVNTYNIFNPTLCGGDSFNNLIISGIPIALNEGFWLYHFNGKNLYRESKYYMINKGPLHGIKNEFGRFYIIHAGELFHTWFSIGTPKNFTPVTTLRQSKKNNINKK